ncbi:MAG TPA: hypothetical protein VGS97_23285 [Actinocrinis sp.]|uniref:hypothetical protein n=1 Tax=Actinocrinis sp. TaxID=1920516 RepID=UPI002DDCCA55|nr:hypothetical protein [Actinocrinis sp.]HEV2347045.1 hypothetical protein [Actinocrinis sp.]
MTGVPIPATAAGYPVKFSFGMGLDSAAVAMRWSEEPGTYEYGDMSDLVFVVAMTGDEYDATRRLMETHLLPRFRAHGWRLVQLSRAGQGGGYVVLDDSRAPKRMIMRGPWSLSDELAAAATIPQLSHRWCSAHAKSEPLDAWTRDEFGDRPHISVMGYAAEETRRAQRDISYASALRIPDYPLRRWSWDRERCARYLYETVGEPWVRSACGYCPYAATTRSLPALVARWRAEPHLAAQALSLEYTAVALNDRMPLFGRLSAFDLVQRHGLTDALMLHERQLSAAEWAVYDVRRIAFPRRDRPGQKGTVWRSVRRACVGSRSRMTAELQRRAAQAGAAVSVADNGARRAVLIARRPDQYPAVERTLALAPAGATEKQRTHFEHHWRALTARDERPASIA